MFGLLGSLEVRVGGSLLPLTAGKQKAVLATLLLRAPEPVSTDELIEVLWPETPPANAMTALHGYVLQLRRLLEPDADRGDYRVLVTRPPGYALAIDLGQLDVRRFEHLAREGSELLAAGSAAAAELKLREALALWRGSPLADFRYDSFAQPVVSRLEEERLACLEEAIDAELALGRHAELVAELEPLHTEQPLRERFVAQLMTALYRSGRQADALEVYQQTRERLVEELGIDPSSELQALQRSILNQDEALSPPLSSVVPAPAIVRLPSPLTGLVGRSEEVSALLTLLRHDDVRLLTIVGTGGVGKTRLAIAVAGVAVDFFADGVLWVPLQALRDPELVVPAISEVLDETADLEAAIGERRVLICIDNVEQVAASGPALTQLLETCPNLKLLATSREPINVYGEHRYPLGPLPHEDAVALFETRARAVQPDFVPSDDVPTICRRLDHLPLALELAAARIATLTTHQIRTRLDRRLLLLTGGPNDVPRRQQALRATIEWSYELLDKSERSLFERLSVFPGSFDHDAAEAVCGATPTGLESLVRKSLSTRDADGRVVLLETVREFALEQLDEGAVAQQRERHGNYYLDLATRLAHEYFVGEHEAAHEKLRREAENLDVAMEYLYEAGRIEDAGRLLRAATRIWVRQPERLPVAQRWLERVLGHTALTRQTRAELLLSVGYVQNLRGAHEAAAESLRIALELFRESGSQEETALTMLNLGYLAYQEGAEDRIGPAIPLLREALRQFEQLSMPEHADSARQCLALALSEAGDQDDALTLMRDSLSFWEERREPDRTETAVTLGNFAEVLLNGGDHDGARALLVRVIGHPDALTTVQYSGLFVTLAYLAALRSEPTAAARLLGFAQSEYRRLGVTAAGRDRRILELTMARLDQCDDDLAAELEAGVRMTLEEASELAAASLH
ncbi:MAG TPA: BTAD domain-containing putative transcriptional regulator [Gaiellaceae bacterium]|jgi:predicted ATPase/DNA-binding SARP family transcriptional activator